MQLDVRYRTAQEICATLGPVVIRICDGVRTEVADLVRVEQVFDELLEEHAHVAMLLVFTHGTPLPDGMAQRHAKQSMRRYDERLAMGVALLGLGFWFSAFRAALSTLVRFVGFGSISIDGTVEQAISHLTMELIGVDGEQLLRAYEVAWAELTRAQAPPLTGTGA